MKSIGSEQVSLSNQLLYLETPILKERKEASPSVAQQ